MPEITQDVREAATEAGMEAAFQANDEKELSYGAEALVDAAIKAALDYIENLRTNA